MNIKEQIIRHAVQAIADLYKQEAEDSVITLQETRKEFEGDITIVTFPFTRFSKLSPEKTAEDIGNYLKSKLSDITSFSIVKGFLNLSISDSYWLSALKNIHTQSNYGFAPKKQERVMVEYSSPNTNKPLHLGHVRNNLLGYSVAQLLKAAGYEVIKANLINDRGIHICKSMLAWQKFGNNESPESSGMKGDHLVGKYYVAFDKAYKQEVEALLEEGMPEEEAKKNAPLMKEAQAMLLKWEQKDEAVLKLWKMMNGWVYAGFDITYKALGVDFDRYYYESETYLLGKDIIDEGLSKGVFFRKEDGSVWIDLNDEGLDQKLVLRSDGTSVYISQDLGTAQMKYNDYKMQRSIYVVGNEQDYHFKVLFLILNKLGKSWAKGLYHLSYGMVDLPSGKMKSREGTVVDADDLISEMISSAKVQSEQLGKTNEYDDEEKNALYRMIGLGALKYFLLKVDPKKRLLFDPQESIDLQGNTGPFIQYSFARIRSILKKSNSKLNTEALTMPASEQLNANERECIIQLAKFPEVILEAAESYSPALLANYLYDLAKTFNKFYHDDPILKLEEIQLQQRRLIICDTVGTAIERGMKLLGIEVPERM